jgi:hypothetical protein
VRLDQKDNLKKSGRYFATGLHCFLQGLRILGFPCNQFGGQEPGTDEEIKVYSDGNNCLKSVLRIRDAVPFDPWIRDSGWKKFQIRDLG